MFPLPLEVDIRVSRGLHGILLLLHLAAAAALFLAAIGPARWLGLLVLSTSLVMLWRQADQPVRLRGKADGALEVWRETQDWQPVRLGGGSFVLPILTVLRLQRQDRRRSDYLVILADSLPAADFRRLRVWLRWLGTVANAPTPSWFSRLKECGSAPRQRSRTG